MFYKLIKSGSCQTFGHSSAVRCGCYSTLCIYGSVAAWTLRLSFDTVKWRCQGSYQLSSSKSVSSERSGREEYFFRENFRQRRSPTSFRWCSTWGQKEKSQNMCVCVWFRWKKKTPSNASKRNFMLVGLSTWFSMALVCAAETQKRARASVIGVAGKPTTTTPIFLSSISRAKALVINEKQKQSSLRSLTFLTFSPESAVTPQATSEWRSICRSASSH